MNDKARYQQELRAQLDAWKLDIEKMKAISAKASADAQAAMQAHIDVLESKVEEGTAKLLELAGISEDAWESVREGMESAWTTLKTAFKDAASKFKD